MKRRELHERLWQLGRGEISPGSRIAIAGAGISGLHLAAAMVRYGYVVSVFDPLHFGGLRIPMVHVCNTARTRPDLWQKSSAWSRRWYSSLPFATRSIERHGSGYGDYFTVLARQYLRDLRSFLSQQGVKFVRETIDEGRATQLGFTACIVATGRATEAALNAIVPMAARPIPGLESYFGNANSEPFFSPENAARLAVTTNFMRYRSRAAFIHRNDDTEAEAKALAASMYPHKRRFLFGGVRMTSRDRLPVVGRLPGPAEQPFFFTAMGYHAMTYAPYLAEKFAAWLAGHDDEDRNLICGLTPARFIPREYIGKLRAADVQAP